MPKVLQNMNQERDSLFVCGLQLVVDPKNGHGEKNGSKLKTARCLTRTRSNIHAN